MPEPPVAPVSKVTTCPVSPDVALPEGPWARGVETVGSGRTGKVRTGEVTENELLSVRVACTLSPVVFMARWVQVATEVPFPGATVQPWAGRPVHEKE
jgi:hypothetical protein